MAFTGEDLIVDNLRTSNWLGEVIDVNDPRKEGRIKVRVYGKFDLLEDKHIPWARAQNMLTGGSSSGSGMHSNPKLGSVVGVRFDNGNLYEPEWYKIQNISEELKEELSESYENAHSLIYDTVTEGGLKIFFTEDKGLVLDYKETQINIKPDNSIIVQNPNGDFVELLNNGNCTINVNETIDVNCSNANIKATNKVHIDSPKIHLGKNAIESVIKGDTFQKLFNSHVHIGNSGAPTSPPSVPLTGIELSKITKTQ